MAVGNLMKNGYVSSISSNGDQLFLVEPRTDILSTVPDNKTAFKSGTSMAAPHVSGVIALMLERNPNLTLQQVRQILAQTAKKIDLLPYDQKKGIWQLERVLWLWVGGYCRRSKKHTQKITNVRTTFGVQFIILMTHPLLIVY